MVESQGISDQTIQGTTRHHDQKDIDYPGVARMIPKIQTVNELTEIE